jgi:hypothetical protein
MPIGRSVKPTTVHTVIRRLVEVLTPRLPEVQVLDGPSLSGNYKPVCLMIGWSDPDRPTASVTRQAPEGIWSNDSESWSLQCLVSAVDGSTNGEACALAREKAADVFTAVSDFVTSDTTVQRTCGVVTVGDQEWWQSPTPNGIEAAILFKLNGKALL